MTTAQIVELIVGVLVASGSGAALGRVLLDLIRGDRAAALADAKAALIAVVTGVFQAKQTAPDAAKAVTAQIGKVAPPGSAQRTALDAVVAQVEGRP